MPTIVYKFRVHRFKSDAEERVAVEEVLRAHRLYNELVAIERQRRQDVRLYWAEVGGYVHLLQASDLVVADLRALKDSDLPPAEVECRHRELLDRMEEVRAEVKLRQEQAIEAHEEPEKVRRKMRAKEIRAEYRERGQTLTKSQLAEMLDEEPGCLSPRDRERIRMVEDYRARGVAPSARRIAERLRELGLVSKTEHIEAKAREAAYVAYRESGVSFGTRGLVRESLAQAIDKSAAGIPRFQPWRGKGRLGIQLQGGESLSALFNDHSWLRLEHMPNRTDLGPSSMRTREGSRRSSRLVRVRFRYGTDGSRQPRWLDMQIILSQEIPAEAQVVRAVLRMERIGLHAQWNLFLTANVPEMKPPVGKRGAAIAIDLGWRSNEGDLRVAYWVDSEGRESALALPSTVVDKLGNRVSFREQVKKMADLASIRSKKTSAMQATVAEWLRANARDLPEWLAEHANTFSRWGSEPRLNRLAEEWKRNRFEGDREIFATVDEWRVRWRHLFEWEMRQGDKLIRRRAAFYQQFAVHCARHYETILVSNIGVAELRQRKKRSPGQLEQVAGRVRAQAFNAAPGELRTKLVRMAKKYGATCLLVAPCTEVCHGCGGICDLDPMRLVHECEHCGISWDQDANAAKNQLKLWRDQSGDAGVKKRKGRMKHPKAKGAAS